MKYVFTLFSALFAASTGTSQTANAVVFSENGERFTLLLNGEKKNEVPAANVRAAGLTSEFYQARIDFEDPGLADFSSNTFAVHFGQEVTYMVKVNKKGEYVLRFQSETPISQQASTSEPQAPSPDVKRYAEVDDAPPASPATNRTSPSSGTQVTVTETTRTSTSAPGENVSIGMNVGGVNMGINMNVTGFEEMEVEETQTITTTSTTRSQAQPAPTVTVKEEAGSVSRGGCARPMDNPSFQNAKTSIADKGFDETRLTMARQIAKSNCLTAVMIRDIMKTFGFEETRLDFARYAYEFCFDPANYFEVNNAFEFESSIEELNSYIESK